MKNLKLILCFLFLPLCSFAQTVKVQGTVISAEDQEPLIGVSVAVKGTTQGVMTDADGMYSISVDSKATLVFSYVSFDPVEENVNGRPLINVSLIPQQNIFEEVIVMGYSSQKKAELSSAVVMLNANQVNDVTSSDIGNLLQGKVSGVMVSNSSGQPGSTATIQIRGAGSITAQSDPLYVVDGIPGGSFNPNDVETITILKDAGATALYGSAAAGGVIIVTTKQAARNQKTAINFKASYGVNKLLEQVTFQSRCVQYRK